jgi:Zn-dependent M28 family amino/carboxypeptidase
MVHPWVVVALKVAIERTSGESTGQYACPTPPDSRMSSAISLEGNHVRKLFVTGSAFALAAAVLAPTPANAVDDVNSKKLRDAVTVNGILAHLRVLQRIANENDGTRVSGTPGHDASVAYVTSRLKAAGYKVHKQAFTFSFYRETAPAVVSEVSPDPRTLDPHTLTYSGSGTVRGVLVPATNITVPPTPTPSSTSGCAVTDFTPAPADTDAVALVQRGGCDFVVKAANAVAAGYDAVIIFNEGQPGRDEVFGGTLGKPVDIPVVTLSYQEGAALFAESQSGPVTVSVSTSTETDPNRTTYNVIADSTSGDPNKVLVVGAHLDSVAAGPGINDNGSGSATILEIAEELSALKVKPRQQVRFAFWGAEEYGLLGSKEYVHSLSEDEVTKLYANLNFDMLASPNYVRFVYDGDGSDSAKSGPAGSGQIESVFNRYFAGQGLAYEPTEFDGRSDYGPFITVGVPAGGLFSGAEGLKTAEQAAIYGGTAGDPYDACYHQACDTITNVNTTALSELGDAAAHAVYTLAKTKTGIHVDGSRVRPTSLSPAKAAALKAKAVTNPALVGASR